MAQGGVFSLLVGDERFDRYFVATDHLRRRLEGLRAARAAAGLEPAPTFADLEKTHLLYLAAAYRPYVAVASEYARVRPSGDGGAFLGAGGGTCQFDLPRFGDFTSDLVLHVRVRGAGSPGAAPAAATPLLRYCAYPGARIFRRVAFRSAQALLDDYGPDEVVAEGKFFVDPARRPGWERGLGQQARREATFVANGHTVCFAYSDGAQTPKVAQPPLELFIPVPLWFCRDPAQALFNDDAPEPPQRTLTCELAPLEDLLQALLPDPADPGRLLPARLPFSRLALDVSLYVNSLYVNPEIRSVFAARAGFSLIRVHRRQVTPLPAPEGAVLLDKLKYPAEFLLAGVRARALAADFDRWWLMGRRPARPPAQALLAPGAEWNAALGLAQLVVREAADVSALEPALASLGFTAHGVELYPELPAAFYGSHLPLRYRAAARAGAPADPGALLVSFCLFPGADTPSGYYNLSAGRELYANYRLAEPDDYETGSFELVVHMSALNFLLRRGDGLALRYSV